MSRPRRSWRTERRNKATTSEESTLSSSSCSFSAQPIHVQPLGEDGTISTETRIGSVSQTLFQRSYDSYSVSAESESIDDSERPGAYAIYRSDRLRSNSIVSYESRGWDPTIHSDGTNAGPPQLPTPPSSQLCTRVPSMFDNQRFDESRDGRNDEWSANIQLVKPPGRQVAKWVLIIGVVCVGIGVGIVLLLSHFRQRPSLQQNQISSTSTCDAAMERLPGELALSLDPFLKCECFGKLSMNKATSYVYNSLKGYDKFRNHLDENMRAESCDPLNMALVWIAGDIADAGTHGSAEVMDHLLIRFVLVYLYAVWDGKQWTNNDMWVSKLSECEWGGVRCDEQNRVTSLLLPNHNIRGSLETRLGLLSDLRALTVENNHGLTGTIPLEVWMLPRLEDLNLGGTQVGGTIPGDLGNYAPGLRGLTLSDTAVSGPLPSFVGMSNLVTLELKATKLTGTLPAHEMVELSSLKILDLAEMSGLAGPFPYTISLLQRLEGLRLMSTSISGTLPESIGNLIWLEALDLQFTEVEGSLPTSIGNLARLEYLGLDSTSMDGKIPLELGRCTQLQILKVSNSRFTGTLPVELGKLQKLQFVDLQNSSIDPPIPEGICDDKSRQASVLVDKTTGPGLAEAGGKSLFNCSCCEYELDAADP